MGLEACLDQTQLHAFSLTARALSLPAEKPCLAASGPGRLLVFSTLSPSSD
jgi:hypothetical protein